MAAEGRIDLKLYEAGITHPITARRIGWIDGVETCSGATLGPVADAAHTDRIARWDARVDEVRAACISRALAPYYKESLGMAAGFSGSYFGSASMLCRMEAIEQVGSRPPARFKVP